MAQHETLKTFNLENNKWSGHDMTSFRGRFMHFTEVCDPRQSFHSTSKLLAEQKQMQEVEAGMDSKGSCQMKQSDFDKYRAIKMRMASCEHADMKEIIPWHMRVSAFIPTNLPIFLGMVLSPPTMGMTLLWQWLN